LVGVWVGRIRWFGTKRTVEGTLAAILSIFFFTYAMVLVMQFINVQLFQGLLIIIEPVSGTLTNTICMTLMSDVSCSLSSPRVPLCRCRIGCDSSCRHV
jgi:dolichol kinase